jgi:putative RecB family exonuclease
MAQVFSHSRISAYETCPKKYECAYITKPSKGPATIEAFMGNRVHEALEWLYREVGVGHVPDETQLLAKYRVLWEAEWSDAVAVVRAERSADDYRALGERCLRDYRVRYAPFDQGRTIGLELRIELPLDESREHMLMGYVDRVVKVADGVWEIHDYKTSSTLATQQQADADRQLALYQIAVQAAYPDARDVTLVWHYLAFDQEVRSRRTPEQLETLRAETLAAVLAIESAEEFPTKVCSLCDWCEYRATCPAWVQVDAVAAVPRGERADQPLAKLVDDYMAASDTASRAAEERDRLRDAIVTRSGEEGLDRVAGTDFDVRVFRYDSLKLPDPKDPRRAELESVLRAAGQWDRFAQLNGYALSKAVEAGDLPGEVLPQVLGYVTIGRAAKLYPRRRI